MVFVNDKEYQLTEYSNLLKVLSELKIEMPKGIAVAVNNNVVPRSQWPQFKITEQDKIIIIKAVQGG
jgi:sulfur carrier protein